MVVREGPATTSPGTLLRAALPAVPGLDRLPGVARTGTTLPDLTLTRTAVRVDPRHVTAYAELCGFAPHERSTARLPLTYPHLLGFPLHLAIMTDPGFPFPAVGTVHLGNVVEQRRAIAPDEPLDVTAYAERLRAHPRGRAFDLVTDIRSGEEDVWRGVSTYLRIGRRDPDATDEAAPLPLVPPGPVTWRLPADLGRRYAAVSGDRNPIHLYALTAKAFGFPRQIAHGMWSAARCVAALDNRLPDAVGVRVDFKKPVLLPATVAFGADREDDGMVFSLTRPEDGAPHLLGSAGPLD